MFFTERKTGKRKEAEGGRRRQKEEEGDRRRKKETEGGRVSEPVYFSSLPVGPPPPAHTAVAQNHTSCASGATHPSQILGEDKHDTRRSSRSCSSGSRREEGGGGGGGYKKKVMELKFQHN